MKRKILCNSKNTFTGYPKGKIGTPLSIMDKEGNVLKVGDTVKYFRQIGVILYNPNCGRNGKYGVAISDSMWYGDNPYDIAAYGKFIEIPMDNGDKIHLEKLG